MRIDARIPVRFADLPPGDARADQALLLPEAARDSPSGWLAVVRLRKDLPREEPGLREEHGPREEHGAVRRGHQAGCSCCAPRSAHADTLIRLFQARARGEIGFFRGIVASLPAAEAASLRAVLQSDPFLSGCFVSVDKQANSPNSEP